MDPACLSRIVARPGQVVRVAKRGFILTQPQQPCRPSCCCDRLVAHAQTAEPGWIRADDPVERKQRRTRREGRLTPVQVAFPLGSCPTWQGLQRQRLSREEDGGGGLPSRGASGRDGARGSRVSHGRGLASSGALSPLEALKPPPLSAGLCVR